MANSRAKRPLRRSWIQAVYTTRAEETARAARTKRSVMPRMSVREARRTMPPCGLPARGSSTLGDISLSVLFVCGLLGGGALFLRALVARLAVLGGGFGLFAPLVVGRVEAGALERDVDRVQHLPDRRAAFDARGQRVFGELLHHVEDVPVLALILVDRHPASTVFKLA